MPSNITDQNPPKSQSCQSPLGTEMNHHQHIHMVLLFALHAKMLLSQAVYFLKVTSPSLGHDGATDLHAPGTLIFMVNKIMVWTDLYVQMPSIAQHKWHNAYLQLGSSEVTFGCNSCFFPSLPLFHGITENEPNTLTPVIKTQATKRKRRKGCREVEIKSPIWMLQCQADCTRGDIIMFYCNFIMRGTQNREVV